MISRSTDIRAALRSRQRGFLLNPYRFGPPTDPLFSQVQLLLHMDGTNGGTTFTDSSSAARSISVTNTTTSNGQIKFGTAAGLFSGSGYLQAASAAAWDLSSGDLTIELWVYPTSTGTARFLVDSRNPDGAGWAFYLDGSNRLVMQGSAGSPSFVQGVAALSINTWYHIAWTRQSGTNRLFIGGVLDTTNSTATITNAASYPLQLGQRQNAGDLRYPGYMDDVRITKGTARYTSAFTPPTAAFPNS